ncbi:hypothetical protein KVV02_003124 [Mortierella alpina]|uniref:Metal homeostatis protein bsd2 n=1 Tax=Mortierella alpina TaxID=64518 RepID=A0A9P8CYT7_MORAP|nr:hypothetical protein KVV02_003124 [Mortierella alpina]
MSRGHTYAQIPVSEAHDDETSNHPSSSTITDNAHSLLSNLPRIPSSASPSAGSSRYSRIHNEEFDEIDEDEANVMLRPLSRPSDSEITEELSLQPQQQPTSAAASGSSSQPAAPPAPTRPQFPAAAGARRMIQQTMDGVFSNLSAKPRVEKPFQEELPPPYKAAALDQSPIYYETTVVAPGYLDDEVLVDGLPVGGFVGFMWNMIISMSFQFVGFFLTYLLHTSHATKNGSKTGLGITFITMGWQMLSGKTDVDEGDPDGDTGYIGSPGQGLASIKEYMWLSYFLMFLGFAIILQSGLEFLKAKRTEMVINATSSTSPARAAEAETVNDSVV